MTNEEYFLLSKKLPEEAFSIFPKEETGLDYDITTHNYQFAVNRMNEVLGENGWQVEELSSDVIKTEKKYTVVKKIAVKLVTFDIETKTFFENGIRWAYGGGESINLSDAHKSAVTNGLKKALAMFGVGKETYEQSIDDDFVSSLRIQNKGNKKDKVIFYREKIYSAKDKNELDKIKKAISIDKLTTDEKNKLSKTYNEKVKKFKNFVEK